MIKLLHNTAILQFLGIITILSPLAQSFSASLRDNSVIQQQPLLADNGRHNHNGIEKKPSPWTQKKGSLKEQGSILRFDEMTGIWVVFASGRAGRPRQTMSPSSEQKVFDLPESDPNCPFCACNEDKLTEPVYTLGDIRVVANKYPAVDPMVAGGRRPRKSAYNSDRASEIYHETPAVGFHEVVIESPLHNAHIATSDDHQSARDLLLTFRERGKAHRANVDDGIEHTMYFKNHGATAGASLVHPHAQIVSTPVVPIEAQRLQSLALAYFQKNRCCVYDRVVEEELSLYWDQPEKSRVVDVSANFIAIVPYASPAPYVITIIPRYGPEKLSEGVDCSDFTSTSDDLLDECGQLLRLALRRLYILKDEPCFNLVVQSTPVSDRGVQAAYKSSAYFRWHIRITPRLGAGAMAGFELGSGLFSNSHMPEHDAAELREVQP